jgi:acyl-CoA synthetase (AMP-forming)/AMP-acid ligase II
MRLIQAFQADQELDRLLIPGLGSLTGGVLHRWLLSSGLATWRQAVVAARVAVCLHKNEDLALALLALDGAAASIVLLPADLAAGDLETLVRASSSTHWLGSESSPAPNDLRALAMPFPPDPSSPPSPRTSDDPEADTEWILPTSGTTSVPKLVVHSIDTLARSLKRNVEKGRHLRWGLLYDLNRFAGVQVFLQSIFGGSVLIVPPRFSALSETLSWLAANDCNALSATPTMWRKILMALPCAKLPLKQITLGGEIACSSVLQALAIAYPDARVVHIYASTEAGVGFAVADGAEGFPASFLQGGVPGAELRIDDDSILQIRPQVIGQRYLDDSESLANAEGYVRTGDRVRLIGDRVQFLGRDSGAINVGGNKVQPEEVERALLAHPAVALARVIPKQSSIMGFLVEALVVLHADQIDPSQAPFQLREWCGSKLERYKVPAMIRIVDHIANDSTGKLSRKSP